MVLRCTNNCLVVGEFPDKGNPHLKRIFCAIMWELFSQFAYSLSCEGRFRLSTSFIDACYYSYL